MSNRGRQNVASFLAKDLTLDWRLGAEWFESFLLDHDPASNYLNWQYVAGVGNDPREDRRFNMIKQAKDYDPDGVFVKLWVPGLKGLSGDVVHTPWKVGRDKIGGEVRDIYAAPVVVRPEWEGHAGRRDVGKVGVNKGERAKRGKRNF
ncbi:hypothetical protein HDU67_003906 [Dinochytrium kinnereticum]|nr:hypothetical protein HDU67_003906 [Dinochytrium kinnereticum]